MHADPCFGHFKPRRRKSQRTLVSFCLFKRWRHHSLSKLLPLNCPNNCANQTLPTAMYTRVSIWTIKYLWLFTNYTSFINFSNIFHNCWIKNLFEWCWDPIKQNNENIPRLNKWLADFEPDRATAVVTTVVLMQGMMAAGMCHLVTSISSTEASGRGVRCRHFSKQQNYYKC